MTARSRAGRERGCVMMNWLGDLRRRWERAPARGKLAAVGLLVTAGLLFWLPTIARAVQPAAARKDAQRLAKSLRPSRNGPWRQTERLRSNEPLLQSATPEELTRDPFSIEGFLTGQLTAPVDDQVPTPREPN